MSRSHIRLESEMKRYSVRALGAILVAIHLLGGNTALAARKANIRKLTAKPPAAVMREKHEAQVNRLVDRHQKEQASLAKRFQGKVTNGSEYTQRMAAIADRRSAAKTTLQNSAARNDHSSARKTLQQANREEQQVLRQLEQSRKKQDTLVKRQNKELERLDQQHTKQLQQLHKKNPNAFNSLGLSEQEHAALQKRASTPAARSSIWTRWFGGKSQPAESKVKTLQSKRQATEDSFAQREAAINQKYLRRGVDGRSGSARENERRARELAGLTKQRDASLAKHNEKIARVERRAAEPAVESAGGFLDHIKSTARNAKEAFASKKRSSKAKPARTADNELATATRENTAINVPTKEETAATKIQALARGRKVRREVAQRKQPQPIEDGPAEQAVQERTVQSPKKWSTKKKAAVGIAGTAAVGAAGVGIAGALGGFSGSGNGNSDDGSTDTVVQSTR